MKLHDLDRWLSACPRPELEALTTPEGADRPILDLLLIGCGSAKRSVRSAAQDMYTGSLTKDAISYAMDSGRIWAIVSGKYGLIWPEFEIDPYDQRIPRGEDLRGWTDRIGSQMSLWMDEIGWRPEIRRSGDKLGKLPARLILEVHASAEYVAGLEGKWWTVEAPLNGLSMLQRRRWYSEQRRSAAGQLSLLDLP